MMGENWGAEAKLKGIKANLDVGNSVLPTPKPNDKNKRKPKPIVTNSKCKRKEMPKPAQHVTCCAVRHGSGHLIEQLCSRFHN